MYRILHGIVVAILTIYLKRYTIAVTFLCSNTSSNSFHKTLKSRPCAPFDNTFVVNPRKSKPFSPSS